MELGMTTAFGFPRTAASIASLALFFLGTRAWALDPVKVDKALDRIAREGDIIFQKSRSSQSEALREGTGSEWTHVGILLKENGTWVVAEAIQPVRKTAFLSFVGPKRSRGFFIKRVRPEILAMNAIQVKALKAKLKPEYGKSYDIFFQWKDDLIYCSELVWKAFYSAFSIEGKPFELSRVQRMKDLKLDGPAVKKLIVERYHASGKALDLEERVVTPVALFESGALLPVLDSATLPPDLQP